MSKKHTPTPWHVQVEEKTRRDDVYIVGNPTGELGGNRQLAYMIDTWAGTNTEANAAMIVKAVNAHDKLVTAAKEALKLIQAEVADGSYTEQVALLVEALTAAEAA